MRRKRRRIHPHLPRRDEAPYRAAALVLAIRAGDASRADKAPAELERQWVAAPGGFLLFALKQLPLLVWGVGVAALLSLVAMAALWHVPAGALVVGGMGIFVEMFGLVIFASLVQPPQKGIKPPLVAKVTLWAFALILVGSGFFSASSVFFDWPVPLRSQMFAHAIVRRNQRVVYGPKPLTLPGGSVTLRGGATLRPRGVAAVRNRMLAEIRAWAHPVIRCRHI